MNTTNAFSRILRQLREDNDLTQEKLCDELEIKGNKLLNKSTISRWENGSRKPNIEIIKDLEEILGTERGKLLRAAGYLGEISPTEQASQAQLHDERVFEKSDSIINEEELISFLERLEFHQDYLGSTLKKVEVFRDLFRLETNKYVNEELTSLCDELVKTLTKLILFLSFSFKGTEDIKIANSNDDTIFKFTPKNRYFREYEEYLEDLLDLKNSASEAYSSYRAAVRTILSV